MEKTPEEKFNEQVWEVLQKIKEESLATEKGKPIEYKFPTFAGVGIIHKSKQKKILHKLQEWKALKIREDPFEPPDSTSYLYYLDLFRPRFDEIYKRYDPEGDRPANELKQNESVEVIIADLISKYSEIKGEKDDKNFYLAISGYGKYIIESKTLSELVKPLYGEAKKDASDYNSNYKKFVKEWKPLARDLLRKAKKLGIEDDPVNPARSPQYELEVGLLKTKTPHFGADLHYFWQPYRELLLKIKDEDETIILSKHLSRDQNDILLYPTYQNAIDSWDKFKRFRKNQVWWAHYQVMRMTFGMHELEGRKDYFNDDDEVDKLYLYEFKSVAQGKNPVFLRRKNFDLWISRLHKYIVARLDFYKNMRATTEAAKNSFAIPPIYTQTQKELEELGKSLSEAIKQSNVKLSKTLIDNAQETVKNLGQTYKNMTKPLQNPQLLIPPKDSKEILLEQFLEEALNRNQTEQENRDEKLRTSIPDFSQRIPVPEDLVLTRSHRWVVSKPTKGKKRIVHYLSGSEWEGPFRFRNSSWFKIFYEYVECARLKKSEIVAKWNINLKMGSKPVKQGYIPTIHRMIKDGLAQYNELKGVVDFKMLKGSKRQSYKMVD